MRKIILWTAASKENTKAAIHPIIHQLDGELQGLSVAGYEPGTMLMPENGCVVVPMGASVLKEAQKYGAYPKNKGINSLHGTVVKCTGGWLVPTFDPYNALIDPAVHTSLACDLRMIARLAATDCIKPKMPEYGDAPDLSAVILYIKQEYERTGEPVEIAVDTETMGLDPYNPKKKIVSIQVAVAPGIADVVYLLRKWEQEEWERFLQQVYWLLNTKMVKVIGANFKYDLLWMLVKWGITCSNFKFDTLLGGSLVNENRSNSLNTHAKLYTPIGGYDDEFNQKYDKAHMELVPRSELVTYGGGDVDSCLRAAAKIKEEIRADNPGPNGRPRKCSLINFYVNILHPAARAFESVEFNGICVDKEKYHKLGKELEVEIWDLESGLLEAIPKTLRQKWGDKAKDFNAHQVREFLFTPSGLNLTPLEKTEKSGQATVSWPHLQKFLDDERAGPWLLDYHRLTGRRKTYQTYYVGFLKHLRKDGRWHPTYFLFKGRQGDQEGGANTGRSSAKDPAIQTVPKHTDDGKRLRECFVSPPGYVMLNADFNQGELRVVACVAGEKTMLSVYQPGGSGDLHAMTASGLAGMSLEDFMKLKETDEHEFDNLRRKGKAGNFGLLYGMGAEGFVEYAWANFGMVLSVEEAEEFRAKFFHTYPGLTDYHSKQKNLVMRDKMVRSPLGRIRHLPMIDSPDSYTKGKAKRQAINSPIQGTLSDMCEWAMAKISEADKEILMSAMIHDNILSYVREEQAVEKAKLIQEIMGDLPYERTFGWRPQIPFPADTTIGYDLANQVAIEKWEHGGEQA